MELENEIIKEKLSVQKEINELKKEITCRENYLNKLETVKTRADWDNAVNSFEKEESKIE